MKKAILAITAVLVFIFCLSLSVNAAEKTDPAKSPDFKIFFTHFQEVVKSKDKTALKGIMAKSISYSFGTTKTDPDSAIKYIEKNKLWKKFDEILSKGYVFSKDINGYVSPPDYVKVEGYMGYRAGFTKEKDCWKLIFFIAGD